ncbi:MAG: phosphate acyltransferase PlsX [candidate division Zixibacteria bacterium]|nr:phosphate acyltransferase PlsX [candidate division Zixibacteria bacterium]
MVANRDTHTIVLDVMGADRGPEPIIMGGVEAARKLGDSVCVILVGNQGIIENILAGVENCPGNIEVLAAESEIPMHISATDGVRMRDSSVAVGLKALKRKQAVAFVSPGNTGAVMATSLLTLGRIKGVARPAITTMFPTSAGKPCVVLDAGANADCKPLHLSQFAVMGAVYSSVVFSLDAPRVGLISIGEERSKGNELVFSTSRLLHDSHINFVGNIEGRDILSGTVDVAVTDGFTGNILLKFAESIQPLMVRAIQRQIQTNIFSRFGVMLLLPFLKRMKSTFDYAESGGAPLLGVNGIVIICHGSSNSRAIANAVQVAHGMAEKRINKRIHDELITNHFGKNNESGNKSPDHRDGVVCPASSDDQR